MGVALNGECRVQSRPICSHDTWNGKEVPVPGLPEERNAWVLHNPGRVLELKGPRPTQIWVPSSEQHPTDLVVPTVRLSLSEPARRYQTSLG